jgi:hypothetical protein
MKFMIIESVGECKSFPQHNQTDVWILYCPYCRLKRTGSSLSVKRFAFERKAKSTERKANEAHLKGRLPCALRLVPCALCLLVIYLKSLLIVLEFIDWGS